MNSLDVTYVSPPPPEINEAEAVVALCPLQGDRFSYALANGIVGVYSGQERFWRIKVSEGVSSGVSNCCL